MFQLILWPDWIKRVSVQGHVINKVNRCTFFFWKKLHWTSLFNLFSFSASGFRQRAITALNQVQSCQRCQLVRGCNNYNLTNSLSFGNSFETRNLFQDKVSFSSVLHPSRGGRSELAYPASARDVFFQFAEHGRRIFVWQFKNVTWLLQNEKMIPNDSSSERFLGPK